jgi:hypothetical protein
MIWQSPQLGYKLGSVRCPMMPQSKSNTNELEQESQWYCVTWLAGSLAKPKHVRQSLWCSSEYWTYCYTCLNLLSSRRKIGRPRTWEHWLARLPWWLSRLHEIMWKSHCSAAAYFQSCFLSHKRHSGPVSRSFRCAQWHQLDDIWHFFCPQTWIFER